ncbi:hypothetical protein VOLCADRAFT_104593 [Volvox carteri f. nagariensis]|uniref:Ig-like domain-containing protein n=1 Tax=Volvox carteri f. nagariensis TaxID=3068 RepID=D8TUQ6_VOLCA|nr:uncharacterized protein VOLCADRAFT_104593 [Volvox carteri f. nagariensis]EFJ48866.1 hypothetical protein VOLCADRAFT_104593 [Volvox carteri f. nagariensis]|eukprot:XP_002950198.1 hypothetical protein VOLCADRAFT_104593 [Volvox carteri f. nagariensis]
MERVADVPAHGECNRDPSDFALTNKNLVCCYVCRLIKSRNQAELEVRQVLDAEHRILEEVFPRHVLEVMTSDKRRTSAFGGGGGGCPSLVRTSSLSSTYTVSGGAAATAGRQLSCGGRGVGQPAPALAWRRITTAPAQPMECTTVATIVQASAASVINFMRAVITSQSLAALTAAAPPLVAINVASRMESTGVPGAVHISAATRALLCAAADGFLSTGGIPVEGKGFMLTYVYDPCGVAPQRSQTISRTGSAVPGIGREGPQVPGGEASSGTPTEAPPPLPQ